MWSFSDFIDPGIDVLFLLDGSTNVGKENFGKFINFTVQFIQPFTVSENMTNVAAGVFSDVGEIVFPFNSSYNKASVIVALEKILYPNKTSSNLTDALTKAKDVAFMGDRDSAPDVVVILTDKITENVTVPAQALKDDGVKVYLIAIGEGRNETLLRNVPSEPEKDHLFTPPSFDELDLMLPEILIEIIAGKGIDFASPAN